MKAIDRLLIFDLKGPLAHFRKFYTSSSSLSYSFPPRTTSDALIAGLLGRQRVTYYEEFSSCKCRIALSIRTPVRKIMQSINYLRTEKEDGYSRVDGVIRSFVERNITKYPTAVEFVVSSRLSEDIIYRIYFWHEDEGLLNELYERVRGKRFVYPPYLGISELLADIKIVDFIVSSESLREVDENGLVEIATVVNKDNVKKLDFSTTEQTKVLQYIDEKMPFEFGTGREIKRNNGFIYEKNQRVIRGRFKTPHLEIIYRDPEEKKENILFMEQAG